MQRLASAGRPGSPWTPFRSAAFSVVWSATLVANVGTWMYNAASGWLMTSLDPSPLTVSLVQVANSLPVFLLALPAGALADVIDRRKLLAVLESLNTLLAALFAAAIALGWVTPAVLLVFTFLIGIGSALTAPAWQAVVPQLVERAQLPAAITANSTGFNLSRAVGPALGGALISWRGIAAPFWINAASNLAVVGALLWWRPPPRPPQRLPAERIGNAILVGVRHARFNSALRATLVRATAFFVCASAYWALLPLLARRQISGGPALYGTLLGVIGAGAVAGALLLPRLQHRFGADRLVAGGTLLTALALVLYALAREPAVALLASALAGFAWIAVLASLNVAAQLALPEWVRGRGLAVYMAVFFGGLTLGSALWGEVAVRLGLPLAHGLAAVASVIGVPLTRRFRLRTGRAADHSPTTQWPPPITSGSISHERGPILVTVEYRIDPADRDAFLAAIEPLGRSRRRGGAYAWGVFEDAAQKGRILETFLTDTWLEHLRQHERVTAHDRRIQEAVNRFQRGGAPEVTHLVAAMAQPRG